MASHEHDYHSSQIGDSALDLVELYHQIQNQQLFHTLSNNIAPTIPEPLVESRQLSSVSYNIRLVWFFIFDLVRPLRSPPAGIAVLKCTISEYTFHCMNLDNSLAS